MATLNIKNFPEKLAKALKKRANRERRSVAQEAVVLLERALDEVEPSSILELRGLGKAYWKGTEPDEHVARERDSW